MRRARCRKLDAGSRTRGDRSPNLQALRDRPIYKAGDSVESDAVGTDQSPRPTAQFTSDWHAPAKSLVHRHHRRPGVWRSRSARRLRSVDQRRDFLQSPSGSVGQSAGDCAVVETPARLPSWADSTELVLRELASSRVEMALRELTARARLQVALEADRPLLVRELDDNV